MSNFSVHVESDGPYDYARIYRWDESKPLRGVIGLHPKPNEADGTSYPILTHHEHDMPGLWWQSGGIALVHLYALNVESFDEVREHPDPVGPENDRWIAWAACLHDPIVCAWGLDGTETRIAQVVDLIDILTSTVCLAATPSGRPRDHRISFRRTFPATWKHCG